MIYKIPGMIKVIFFYDRVIDIYTVYEISQISLFLNLVLWDTRSFTYTPSLLVLLFPF